MNVIKRMLIAAGTASVALAPIAATAAAPLASISSARVATPSTAGDLDLRGKRDRDDREGRTGTGIILGVLAAALIILAIVIAVQDDDDQPVSP